MGNVVSVQALVSEIELNNYGVIYALMKLRINFHFFADKVTEAKNAYYEFTPNSAEWSEDYSITPSLNVDGVKFEEVLIDLRLKGSINEYDNSGRTFFSEPTTLELTIRAFVQDDSYAGLKNIILLNAEQKVLLQFHKTYEDELKHIGVKTLFETEFMGQDAFSFFTRIWRNVDNENKTMVDDTSLHYFHELGEAHRNIMYSVSCANMWGRYESHYTDNFYGMNDSKVYPHEPSFYDIRHVFYLEAAVEEIYTFYERIAYVASLFLTPLTFDPRSLSFNKLFEKRAARELRLLYLELVDNTHFKWFTDRVKNQHKQLSEYRHPLIHYKTANPFIRGSYSASRTRIWMDNAVDGEQELEKLHNQMEEILKFVNRELLDCLAAFEQVVLLCEGLTTINGERIDGEILNFRSDVDSSIEDTVGWQQEQREDR